MAEEEVNEDEGEGESSGGGGKKKLIIIIAAVLLLLIGGAAGAYFMGLLAPLLGGDEEVDKVDENNPVLVYSGWMLSSSPSLSPLEHSTYDIWAKECRIKYNN